MAFSNTLSMLTNLPFLSSNTTAEYLLPNPSGKFNITLTTGPLIDHARTHSHASNSMPRELMLSVFQPAICEATEFISYMPDKTGKYQGSLLRDLFHVPSDISLLLEARLPVCSEDTSLQSTLDESPILLFSPGYTVPRLYYNYLASTIASEGFVVITIDHPEDANIITYPDGHAIYNKNTTLSPAAWKAHLPARVTDASFVIDQLSNATAMADLLPHRGQRSFPTDRIAMMGHSLGGITSVIAASRDPRIRGAINWDGTFVERPPAGGMSSPVLLMSREAADDATWPAVWPMFKGPKLWVKVADTTHMTFSDLPSLLQTTGQSPAGLEDSLGTIEPAKMVQILTTYATEWMNGVFVGKVGGPLLEGEEQEKFPQVPTVMKDGF